MEVINAFANLVPVRGRAAWVGGVWTDAASPSAGLRCSPASQQRLLTPLPLPLPHLPSLPVCRTQQKPHKVNLSAPQKSILVNLVKGTCGISVVDKYKELCRFNIRTLAMSDEEREAQRAAAPDSKPKPAPAAPAKAEPAGEAAPAAAAGEEQQQEQAEAEEAAT